MVDSLPKALEASNSEPSAADQITPPDVSHLITEDDTPIDNFASEKQQRLLTSCLYGTLPQPFIAAANVGVYRAVSQPPIVPDVFVSFGVQVPDDWWEKQNRCYFVWNFGKSPEIAVELVSNRVGSELADKLAIYEQMRVSYYVVYDPSQQLSDRSLRLFELRGIHYAEIDATEDVTKTGFWLAQVGLGLALWNGEFEGRQATWLRWRDEAGAILLTGDERARQEQQRADQEQQRADRLAAFLKSQGIDPDHLPDSLPE